jgi:membrane fusion protein (multidrug efflux system)
MTDAVAGAKQSDLLRWDASETLDAASRRKLLRRRLFIVFGAVLVIAAAAWGAWWLWVGQRSISTDDAYVEASEAQITPQVEGTISDVPVNDTMHVARGQVLVHLDPADAELAFAQAQANYGQVVRRVSQYYTNAKAAAADVASRQADLQRAQEDYDRRIALAKTGAVSGDELTASRNALDTARAAITASQQTLASQEAMIRGTDAAHHPEVLAAKAALDKASLDLSRTVIRAPFDGIVAQNTAQIGQRVRVGAVLMSVVPIDQVYVNANFKEGQLTRVHIGQAVTLTSDLYGSDVVFHGHVQGLSGGTGSALAVIPAENATGNWIKVVQRLPVRVSLDRDELIRHPLRVGLSMTASIDISQ